MLCIGVKQKKACHFMKKLAEFLRPSRQKSVLSVHIKENEGKGKEDIKQALTLCGIIYKSSCQIFFAGLVAYSALIATKHFYLVRFSGLIIPSLQGTRIQRE
jgi:hypothetical protein